MKSVGWRHQQKARKYLGGVNRKKCRHAVGAEGRGNAAYSAVVLFLMLNDGDVVENHIPYSFSVVAIHILVWRILISNCFVLRLGERNEVRGWCIGLLRIVKHRITALFIGPSAMPYLLPESDLGGKTKSGAAGAIVASTLDISRREYCRTRITIGMVADVRERCHADGL